MKALFELRIKDGVVKLELTWELDYVGTKYIIFRNVKGATYDKRVWKLAIFRE
jgi:hypothetical protein